MWDLLLTVVWKSKPRPGESELNKGDFLPRAPTKLHHAPHALSSEIHQDTPPSRGFSAFRTGTPSFLALPRAIPKSCSSHPRPWGAWPSECCAFPAGLCLLPSPSSAHSSCPQRPLSVCVLKAQTTAIQAGTITIFFYEETETRGAILEGHCPGSLGSLLPSRSLP